MHPRILIRKLLGRKGVFLLRNIASEVTFGLHLIKPATSINKYEGITAMVCTYNEADWIEPSILSIKDLVDEYVIVDSSTDETPMIMERLRDEHGLNLRMFRMPPGDLVAARNYVLKEAKYKWILHWDADFIAKPELIDTIKKLNEELNVERYYLVYWPMIRLCGDLYHVCHQPLHIEHWLFTWSSRLRYKWIGKYDSLIAPTYMYKVVFINKPLGLHLANVRNPARLFIKHVWWKFRREADKLAHKGITYEELAKIKAKELYDTDDIYEAGRKLINTMVKNLPKYNKEVFGDYPPILKEYAKKNIIL